MRIRSFVSSAAILGTLLASSALVGDALAQKGTMMSPSTAWAVNKVDNQAGPYCTMARQFNKSTVLTLAQNENSETSIAFDFQRPAFQAVGKMGVVLDPGAGQQRVYQTQPVSNKAFVVRLGRDDSFFKALERTGSLRVEINNQSYNFNVSDIDKGQFKLDACVANMVMPAAGDEGPLTPDATATVVADSGKSFRQEINALRGQISRLRDENESLKVQMKTRTDSVAETSGSVAELAAQIRDLEDQNARLEGQMQLANAADVGLSAEEGADIAALREENLRLKAELQTAKPQEEVLVGLETEIQALKSQNDNLQAALDEAGDDRNVDDGQLATLREQIEILKAKNTELNTQILAARQEIGEEVSGEYEQKIAALSQENAALKSTMGKKGVDAELLEQLRQQIAQAENENRLLQETAAQAQQNLEEQLKQDNLLELEAVRAEQSNKITELEQELASIKAESVTKAEELVALGAETSTLKALEEENQTLKQQLAAMETQRGQTETLVERIANLELENEALQKQVVNTPVFDSGEPAELAALRSENETLKAQILDSDAQAERIAALESEIGTLKTANDDLQNVAQNDVIEGQLQVALDANTALSAQIEQQDIQLSELQVQRDEMKIALADVVAVAEQYKHENAAQKEQINALEGQQAALQERAVEAVPEISPVENNVQPVSAPKPAAEKAPQPLLKEAMAEPVQVPTPARKPYIAPPALMPVEEMASASLPVENSMTDDVVEGDRYQRLTAIQKQMRATHVDDQRHMQQLARDYMAVKSEIERAEYGVPDMETPAEVVKVVAAVTEQAAPGSIEGQPLLSSPSEEDPYTDLTNLTEAQIQERALKLAQESNMDAVRNDAVMTPLVDEPVEENIVLSQSADPFQGIEVQAREMGQAQKIDLGALAAEDAPLIEAPEVVSAASTPAAPVVDEAFSVKALITEAEVVSTPEKIKRVDGESDDFDVAYQWNGGSIYGSAEQKEIASADQFDGLVQEYLERTQTRCPGEFAIVPDNTVDRGSMRADSYEVACVGDNVSSGASLLFFNQGGTFTVVAHEAPTGELGTAMNYRNKLMRFITGS